MASSMTKEGSRRRAWRAPRLVRLDAGAAETHPSTAVPESGSGS